MNEPDYEFYRGWRIRQLYMPNGDRIIVAFIVYNRDGSYPVRSLYDSNHNVYRLSPQGKIIWQVMRDESILPAKTWEVRHELARQEGATEGCSRPFHSMVLEYKDGSRNTTDPDGNGTGILTWEEGCIIHLFGSQNNHILDPETGIATYVPSSGARLLYVERIYMPNGDKIVLRYSKIKLTPRTPYFEANFNILRLSPQGKVIWHVTKDDDFMLDWWKDRHELKFDEVEENFVPFCHIVLHYADGSQSISDEHKDGTNIVTWKEGCSIYLQCTKETYILDPETGTVVQAENTKKLISKFI